jgi:hypothetical protein
MGIFSFLFGGKKPKDKAALNPTVEKPAKVEKSATDVVPKTGEAAAPAEISRGVLQAKLRLKLSASLRTGDRMVAYESARALADIQLRAGRKTVARMWQKQADQLKAELSA